MSSGRNRITELEQSVSELQSTVRGLTEELVEANQRIRDLEEKLAVAEATAVDVPADEPAETHAEDEEAKPAESQKTDTETGERKIEDDIIVA